MYIYYWNYDKFQGIVNSENKVEFSYYNDFNYRNITPKLKSHHFYQISNQVFEQLKAIKIKIINKIHFKFDDKDKQSIYNYCCGFCFDWKWLEKYTHGQVKRINNKKKLNKHDEFLLKIYSYINDNSLYTQLKQDIKNRFYEIKSKYKCPVKKELQIICNTTKTISIELKEFQWVFSIDSNTRIGGTDKKGVFDKLIIPVKFSNYHKEILKDKKLVNSFTLKLNRHNKIEIIGCYEVEANYPKPKENTELVGIDIGLKKLIMASDGELIEQNPKILKRLDKIVRKQSNRDRLESHLQKKLNDNKYRLSDTRYLLRQVKLTDFVKCDNRFKIKQFLKGREDNHIVMEDLNIQHPDTYSKTVNNMLRRLHIQQIKNDIVKYSKEQGIKVSLINPAYTSQECPICGHISKENRKTQEKFCCVKCNYTDDADHNASVNIMNRLNKKDIKLNTPLWRVRELLNINT